MIASRSRPLASRLAILSLAATLLVVACDDDPVREPDPVPGPTTGTLLGLLVRAENGEPAGRFEVSLLDLSTFAPVALTESDSQGVFVFDGLEPGDYLPTVHAANRVLFGLPTVRFRFAAAETLRAIYPLAAIAGLDPSELYLEGEVVDATTEEPVPFARIEMNSFDQGANPYENGPSWSEFRGSATTLEPVADAEGRFRLGPISPITFFDPETGGTNQIVPSWRVTAPGYRSAAFDSEELGRFRTTARVELEPGIDDGVITGRVVGVDGTPRAGVYVHAEWRRGEGQFPRAVPGSDVLSRVLTASPFTTTDEQGLFTLTGLPMGGYNLLAGAPGDDGWIGIPKQGVELRAASPEVTAGEIIAQPTLVVLGPASDAQIVGSGTLAWEPFPGATRYELSMRRTADFASFGASLTAPTLEIEPGPPPFDEPSLIRWTLRAFDAEGREISATDRPQLFRYDPGAGGQAP